MFYSIFPVYKKINIFFTLCWISLFSCTTVSKSGILLTMLIIYTKNTEVFVVWKFGKTRKLY